MTKHMKTPVFFGSSAIIFALLAVGILVPESSGAFFSDLQDWIFNAFGWLYILAVAGFLILVLVCGLGGYGRFKLGPDDSEPEFGYLSWLAMLFAAGMGIGLMFFAVAEPILHYSQPPTGDGGTIAAARQAMVFTFFHWGVHAWAIYAVVGLSLAYFGFRYNLPLTVSSGLYPFLKDRIHGPIGHVVDIFAICGTLFGIATSLGFGVLQINAGLTYLLGLPNSTTMQVILIAIVTACATLSVISGLDVGIRRLSELNLLTAVLLMVFILVVGPTAFLLQAFTQNIGNYLDQLFKITFNLYAYVPNSWIGDWTLFYWAWWISWSPFVGMFIARISYGRTVREFVIGVLLVPAGFTFLWMTVFGNTAIALDMTTAAGALSQAAATDVPVALFRFLEQLPVSGVTSALAVLLVAVFFVTSSDSGSMVVDTIASGGTGPTPIWQRLYWCSLEGVTAALLLLSGGLGALQTATLVSALPFTLVMIVLGAGLLKGMAADAARAQAHPHRHTAQHPSWTVRLERLLHNPSRKEVELFIGRVVEPRLREVADRMRHHGLEAKVEMDAEKGAVLTVPSDSARSFVYGVAPVRQVVAAFTAAEVTRPEQRRPHIWTARTWFNDGSRGYDIMDLTGEQVVADVLTQFEAYQALLQSQKTSLYIGSPDIVAG